MRLFHSLYLVCGFDSSQKHKPDTSYGTFYCFFGTERDEAIREVDGASDDEDVRLVRIIAAFSTERTKMRYIRGWKGRAIEWIVKVRLGL